MGFTVHVERRIFHLQQTVKVDTQELRNKWMTELDDLFSLATSIAKGDITQQEVGGKLLSITPREREKWAQIAAKIGMVVVNLSRGYDERQIDKDLDKLEKLLDKNQKLYDDAIAKASPALKTEIENADSNAGS